MIMAKIIVLGAMKGGVGKSVSTFNLAYSLRKLGKNVLVVDFDSSANITRCVVEDMKTIEISIGDLMMNQMVWTKWKKRSMGNSVFLAVRFRGP